MNEKNRLAALVCLAAAILVLLLPGGGSSRGYITLTVLDVGQGDALLVSADGCNVLIDAGGRPENPEAMGEYVVVPYLKAQRIGRLDMVFNTHPDIDHIGGLFAVLDEIRVDYLAVFSGYIDSANQAQLLAQAGERDIPVVSVAAGDVFNFSDNFSIRVLAPSPGAQFVGEAVNNGSLVLQISYQDFDLLTCGDLVGDEMTLAVQDLDCADIEVLQLPHHGSRYSYAEDWYAAFTPEAVFISVGRDNSYGHPGTEVVAYWQERGVPVLRTDLYGSCRITYQDGYIDYETVLTPALVD